MTWPTNASPDLGDFGWKYEATVEAMRNKAGMRKRGLAITTTDGHQDTSNP